MSGRAYDFEIRQRDCELCYSGEGAKGPRIVETVYRSPGQRFVRTQRSLAMEKPIHDCQRDWATCRGESLEKARFCSEEQCSVELDLSAWWSLSWWN
ncbi:hypothetical protein RHMOL_RhmolMtG0006200 (mitochondrion) [Rhododendron molle]|nr:hypothetical protein RHMOL_RhmolMtG0006200 [Rhododendron molle]